MRKFSDIEKQEDKIQQRKAISLRKKGVGSFSKILLSIFLLFLSFLIISSAFFIQPIVNAYIGVKNIQSELDSIVQEDLQTKDLTLIEEKIDKIDANFNQLLGVFTQFEILNSFEATKGYYDNIQIIQDILKKSKSLLQKVKPDLKLYLKTAGFKVDNEILIDTGESDNNLQGMVKAIPDLINLYDNIEGDIKDILTKVNEINPAYLPPIVRGKVEELQVQTKPLEEEFPEISDQFKQTLSVLPELLGVNDSVTYLVVFTNEKELRASGGLLTAYGTLKVESGEIVGDITSTDMWDLEVFVNSNGKAPRYNNIYGQLLLMQRGCGGIHLRAQDAGIYPDVSISMDMFKDYYNAAFKINPTKYPKYDHIINLNTYLASDLIKLVEPLKLKDGRVITSDNVAKLIFSQTNTIKNTQTRKSIIGDIADVLQVKYKELPSSKFPLVIETLIKTIQAKNLTIFSTNEKVADFLDEYGLNAKVVNDFEGDYFQLSEAQVCSLKANFYIKDTIYQNVTIDKYGNISNKVKIEWQNEKVFDIKEKDILSNSTSYLYRAWVRVMTPKSTKINSSDGMKASKNIYPPVSYYDNKLQKQISDNVIWFDHRRSTSKEPVRKLSLNVTYTLPKSINYNSNETYTQLIQKHPGKKDERVVFTINQGGSTKKIDFVLDRDKVVEFKQGELSVTNYQHPLDNILNVIKDFSK